MSYRLVLRPAAEIDAQLARDWYENERAGLGPEFQGALIACLESVLAAPLQRRLAYRDIRWWKLERFPYLVFYRVKGDEVCVTAIVHGARHPARWQRRA